MWLSILDSDSAVDQYLNSSTEPVKVEPPNTKVVSVCQICPSNSNEAETSLLILPWNASLPYTLNELPLLVTTTWVYSSL